MFLSLIMAVGRCSFALCCCIFISHPIKSPFRYEQWTHSQSFVTFFLGNSVFCIIRASHFPFYSLSICFNLNENLLLKWKPYCCRKNLFKDTCECTGNTKRIDFVPMLKTIFISFLSFTHHFYYYMCCAQPSNPNWLLNLRW